MTEGYICTLFKSYNILMILNHKKRSLLNLYFATMHLQNNKLSELFHLSYSHFVPSKSACMHWIGRKVYACAE